jgi:hypothetical protein
MYYNIHESFPSELTVQVLAQGCYFVLLSGIFYHTGLHALSKTPFNFISRSRKVTQIFLPYLETGFSARVCKRVIVFSAKCTWTLRSDLRTTVISQIPRERKQCK